MARFGLFTLIFGVLCLGAAGKPLASAELDAFLTRSKDAAAKLQTVQADFTQTRASSLFASPLVTKGVCSFGKGGKLRWETSSPYWSALLSGGGKVAKFDLVAGRPRRLDLGDVDLVRDILAMVGAWAAGDFAAAKDDYQITADNQGSVTVLRLKPKSAALLRHVQAVELSFDNATLGARRVKIVESPDDSLTIEFTNERRDPPLPPGFFDPVKPWFAKP